MSFAKQPGAAMPRAVDYGSAQLKVIKTIAADVRGDVAVILDPSDAKTKLAGRQGAEAQTFAEADIAGRAMRLRFPTTLRGYRQAIENITSTFNGSDRRMEAVAPGMVKALAEVARITMEIEANTLEKDGKQKAHGDIDKALLEKQLRSLSDALTAVETILASQWQRGLDDLSTALGSMVASLKGDAQGARRP